MFSPQAHLTPPHTLVLPNHREDGPPHPPGGWLRDDPPSPAGETLYHPTHVFSGIAFQNERIQWQDCIALIIIKIVSPCSEYRTTFPCVADEDNSRPRGTHSGAFQRK